MTERKYKSDAEVYEVFVGTITPQEFVEPFGGDVQDAIASLIEHWEYDEEPPSWLEDALGRYVTEKLEESQSPKWVIHSIQLALKERMAASDLRHHAELAEMAGTEYECYRFQIQGKAEVIELLWIRSEGRAGIAWGADAVWTDASSAIDALERYLNGDIIN